VAATTALLLLAKIFRSPNLEMKQQQQQQQHQQQQQSRNMLLSKTVTGQ
jgi:hypothetical protein